MAAGAYGFGVPGATGVVPFCTAGRATVTSPAVSACGLAYMSEAEDTSGRLWRKQRKLEARLESDGGRPKWMRARTYERYLARIDAVEEARDADFFLSAARLFRRHKPDVLKLLD